MQAVLHASIVDGLREYNGIRFSYRDKGPLSDFREMIENSLHHGHPLVLDVKPDSPSLFGYVSAGHYVVVAGMKESEALPVLVIHDPNHRDGHGIGQRVERNLDDV